MYLKLDHYKSVSDKEHEYNIKESKLIVQKATGKRFKNIQLVEKSREMHEAKAITSENVFLSRVNNYLTTLTVYQVEDF